MPLLYDWRRDNYRRDLDEGVAFHLNQSSPRLHAVDRGDTVWAFTRDERGRYVLPAELIVRAKTTTPKGDHHGPYRVWGDREQSRYFSLEKGADVEPLIRAFSLSMGGGVLGRSFQGPGAVRVLSLADHQALVAFASDLELEARARNLDEERLELLLSRPQPEVGERRGRHKPGRGRSRVTAFTRRAVDPQ